MPMAPEYLQPTAILDSGHPEVRRYALAAVGDARDDAAVAAVRLFYAVRDDIWYDPYVAFYRAEHYRASSVLKSRRGFCISKAGLLCALGRACGIPSRLGFADVRNHLATRELIARMGGDLFVYHGFTEFYLGGRWIKATPTFNKELCRKHRVAPLEFDGRTDAVFQPFNLEAAQYMTYVRYHAPPGRHPAGGHFGGLAGGVRRTAGGELDRGHRGRRRALGPGLQPRDGLAGSPKQSRLNRAGLRAAGKG